jgi:p-aminobenzoyl-glutamate transporter AbgT
MQSFVPGFIAVLMSAASVLAQQNQNQNSPGAFMGSIVPMMVIMFVVIYFLMIRPEQKKQKDRQKMINNMKVQGFFIPMQRIYLKN